MAAVFAESVRNFRQFALFLLSSAACDLNNIDSEECQLFFKDNPMAAGGSWIETDKRGFYGWDKISHKRTKVLNKEKKLSRSFYSKIKEIYILNNFHDISAILNGLQNLEYPDVIDEHLLTEYCKFLGNSTCEWNL